MVRPQQALAFVALAAILAAVSNFAAPATRRLPWVGQHPDAWKVPQRAGTSPTPTAAAAAAPPVAAPESPGSKDYPAHPDRPWADISGDEAVALHSRGVPFLDARRTSVYAEGHIAGARSFPIWESTVDDGIKKLFEEGYDVNAPLAVYCSGGDCEDSPMLAQRLHGHRLN